MTEPDSHIIRHCTFVLVFALLLPADSVHAKHPVSITVASTFVSPELATMKLHVFLEDLYLFHNLQPDDAEFLDRATLERGIELHKAFIDERLIIRDVNGERLSGRIVDVEDDAIPTEGVPLAELMAHKIVFEIEYRLAHETEFLTFSQQFTDDEGLLPSEMRLVVQQENAPAPEEAVLRPDDIKTIRFDWSLPALPADASREQREAWAEQQQQEQLGITSYSSVYSFLYIEDFEVRHEILIPLLTLEQSVLIARDGDEMFELAEQDAARQQIEAYFQSGNPIIIDGVQVAGRPERCDFYGLDFRDFAMQAKRKSVPLTTARVGIILSYPTDSPPSTVQLTWNRFDRFVWSVHTVVFAHDTMQKTKLSRQGDENVFRWTGEPRQSPPTPQLVVASHPERAARVGIPIWSLAAVLLGLITLGVLKARDCSRTAIYLSGAALLLAVTILSPYAQWVVPVPFSRNNRVTHSEAQSAFEALHANLYQAFRYRSEDEVYDVLALGVSGDLLRDIYLQIRKGLVMAEQGGAVARVKDVTIVSGEVLYPPDDSNERAFSYRCRWNVAGTVEHWGHIHERVNQYEADFTVEVVNGTWKITNLILLDDKRLQFETKLRQS